MVEEEEEEEEEEGAAAVATADEEEEEEEEEEAVATLAERGDVVGEGGEWVEEGGGACWRVELWWDEVFRRLLLPASSA